MAGNPAKMIRRATEADAIRIAEIDVTSERFVYKDFTIENRTPIVKKGIEEKYHRTGKDLK